MKEFKGTPGQWKLNRHEKGFPNYGDIQGSYGIGDRGIENIRTIAVLTNYATIEESEANAKLLTAAPLLMNALQAFLSAQNCTTKDRRSRLVNAANQAQAALAAVLD